MIHELDMTLQKLLETGLPPELYQQLSVSFLTPDGDFPPATVKEPAIDLFLYDLRENQELRDTQWSIDRSGESLKRQPPPARVDCSYLISAWVKKSDTQAKDEHRLLGEVMAVLLRHRTLPLEVLQGELAQMAHLPPTVTLHSGRLQSPGEFWQALGGKPKAAFHYTVTIGMDVAKAIDAGKPVTDKLLELKYGQAPGA